LSSASHTSLCLCDLSVSEQRQGDEENRRTRAVMQAVALQPLSVRHASLEENEASQYFEEPFRFL